MTLRQIVSDIVGAAVVSLEPVAGGDIGESAAATLAGGEQVFVKHYPRSPALAVRREAEGLGWLAEPGALPVASVRGFDASARVLVLDWIEPGRPTRAGDAAFGAGLAALHRSGADTFGGVADNFIGSLPQSNRAQPTWAAFYAEERLAPLVRAARAAGRLDARDARRADDLVARLDSLFPGDEPPSRLHGDLWGGNRLCDARGTSWLIDPAAYAGHREMDLAMMRLFGGFSDTIFAAYREVWPPAPGADEREALCQLYPLLVHVVLFGGAYAGAVRRILDRYA